MGKKWDLVNADEDYEPLTLGMIEAALRHGFMCELAETYGEKAIMEMEVGKLEEMQAIKVCINDTRIR